MTDLTTILLRMSELMHQKSFDQIREELNDDTLSNYNNYELFYIRGNAEFNTHFPGLAIPYYVQCIKLNPQYEKAYHNLGILYLAANKKYDAIEVLTTAIHLDPQYHENLLARAILFGETMQVDKALNDLNTLISLNPENARAYLTRGNTYTQLGNSSAALSDYKQAFALDSENGNILYGISRLYYEREDIETAKYYLNKAILSEPNFPRPYLSMAEICIKEGKVSEAMAYCKRSFYILTKGNYYSPSNELIVFVSKDSEIGSLIRYFTATFSAPYLLKEICFNLVPVENLIAQTEVTSQLYYDCQAWDIYIDFIESTSIKTMLDFYPLFSGVVNFHMGNSIKSFNLLLEYLPQTKNSTINNIRTKFYIVKSAIDFAEPYSDLLEIYLHELALDIPVSKEEKYYIGQLYTLANQIPQAIQCLSNHDNFLPSLILLAGIYYYSNENSRFEEVVKQITEHPYFTDSQFSTGQFQQVIQIEDSISSVADNILDHIYLYELIDDLQVVFGNAGLTPPEVIDFKNILILTNSFVEQISSLPSLRETEQFAEFLSNSFIKIAHTIGLEHLQKRLFNNINNNRCLTEIEETINRLMGEAIDNIIAMHIHSSSNTADFYLDTVCYLYLKNSITVQEALHLCVYIVKMNTMGSDFSVLQILSSAEISFAFEFLKLFSKTPFSLIYKVILLVIKKSGLGIKIEKITDDTLDYQIFKNNFIQNLSFLQQKIAKYFTSHSALPNNHAIP